MLTRAKTMIAAALAISALGMSASAVVLWDNGPLATGAVSRNNGTAAGGPGVAAPAGSQWSELFTGNSSAGFTVSPSGATGIFRLADNFVLSAASTVNTVTAFAYVTGSTDAQLFTTGNIRIWSGAPDAPGSTILFGDTTTDRVTSGGLTNLYRIFSTDNAVGGAGGVASPPGTTRRLKTAVFDIGALNLAAGTYWVDYQIVNPINPANAVFHPGVTLTNARGPAGANALQLTTGPSTWSPILDAGDPATLADVAQELAFQVDGVPVPEPTTLSLLSIGALTLLRRRRA